MLRKLTAAALLTLGVVGGVAVTQGTASAAAPAGVYPSSRACADAGNAGIRQGRWYGWRCQNLHSNGQYLLWVSTY